MKEIVIATKNSGKAKEFIGFFKKHNIHAISLLDLKEPIDDIEETGSTFKENAVIKSEQISSILKKPVLGDDSGLVIDALDGDPGIYSARYAGFPSDDQANMSKVIQKLQNVPLAKRTARFVCVLSISELGKQPVFYKGYCEGKIGFTPKGTNGFGYDPIFIPDGFTQTMAELSFREKNNLSHRGQALKQLEKALMK